MVDWYPTLLKLAGRTLEQKLPLDGRDAWPTLTAGQAVAAHGDPAQRHARTARIRVGRLEAGPQRRPAAPRCTDRQSGGHGPDGPETVELFNLADDPSEKKNLAAEHPDKVKELRARYDALASQALPARIKPRAPDLTVPKRSGASADGERPPPLT